MGASILYVSSNRPTDRSIIVVSSFQLWSLNDRFWTWKVIHFLDNRIFLAPKEIKLPNAVYRLLSDKYLTFHVSILQADVKAATNWSEIKKSPTSLVQCDFPLYIHGDSMVCLTARLLYLPFENS